MIKHFLLSKNFWVLNKHLVKTLGIETAFLLSVFADADETLSDSEGWFYQTVETIESITTLNRYKQDLAIDILIEKGVLEKTHKGMPRKRYFRIDSERLACLFVEGQRYSQSKVDDTVSRRSTTSKELTNKELDKELNNTLDQTEELFNEFWEVYPRKIGKKKCASKYKKIDKETHVKIINDIQTRLRTKDWKLDKDSVRYIPHPETYLNNERWNDEIETNEVKRTIPVL